MRTIVLYIIILFSIIFRVSGQEQEYPEGEVNVLQQVVIDGDTLLISAIEEIVIFPEKKFKNRFQAWRYRRLIYNVKKAYPYSKLAAKKLEEKKGIY